MHNNTTTHKHKGDCELGFPFFIKEQQLPSTLKRARTKDRYTLSHAVKYNSIQTQISSFDHGMSEHLSE